MYESSLKSVGAKFIESLKLFKNRGYEKSFYLKKRGVGMGERLKNDVWVLDNYLDFGTRKGLKAGKTGGPIIICRVSYNTRKNFFTKRVKSGLFNSYSTVT